MRDPATAGRCPRCIGDLSKPSPALLPAHRDGQDNGTCVGRLLLLLLIHDGKRDGNNTNICYLHKCCLFPIFSRCILISFSILGTTARGTVQRLCQGQIEGESCVCVCGMMLIKCDLMDCFHKIKSKMALKKYPRKTQQTSISHSTRKTDNALLYSILLCSKQAFNLRKKYSEANLSHSFVRPPGRLVTVGKQR